MNTHAVIHLRHLDLPLVAELAKQVGFLGSDLAKNEAEPCCRRTDRSRELSDEEVRAATPLMHARDARRGRVVSGVRCAVRRGDEQEAHQRWRLHRREGRVRCGRLAGRGSPLLASLTP